MFSPLEVILFDLAILYFGYPFNLVYRCSESQIFSCNMRRNRSFTAISEFYFSILLVHEDSSRCKCFTSCTVLVYEGSDLLAGRMA